MFRFNQLKGVMQNKVVMGSAFMVVSGFTAKQTYERSYRKAINVERQGLTSNLMLKSFGSKMALADSGKGEDARPAPSLINYTTPDYMEKMQAEEFIGSTARAKFDKRIKVDFKLKTRDEHLKQLQDPGAEYDLLIVGGGASGAGVVIDAASRGLNCALIDKFDFASGTSSRSTKMAHGGIRYFE